MLAPPLDDMQIENDQIDSLIPEINLRKSRRHALALATLSIGPVLLLFYSGIHWFPETIMNPLLRIAFLLGTWAFIDLVVAKTRNDIIIRTMKGFCYASFTILLILILTKGLLP